MSVASAPPAESGIPAAAGGARSGEACPLCGAALHPAQEWCLHCGAAARTRLAASPNWKAPISALAAVAVLALGVLAAALVVLAGGSGPAAPAITRIVTTPAALTPSQASTAQSNALPGAAGTGTGTSTLGTGKVTAPKPGTSTTGAGKAGTSTPGAGKAGTGAPRTGKVGAGIPGTGKARTSTPGLSTPNTGTLSPKTREEIARGVKEGLSKVHLHLPSTNTR